MKQLLLASWLIILSLNVALAQRSPFQFANIELEASLTVFADSINRVFQGVDKNRVTSGILEEYGLQFIDHVPFTGTNGFTNDNQLDMNRWRALYGDLYGARINTQARDMRSLAIVNQRLSAYVRDANVELPILHFEYHSIRLDALSSGRIRSSNNRLYDVAGQDPYQLNTAFAVAANDSQLPSAHSSFVFRSNLFFTNTGRTVASLQADFADGQGFVTLAWDTPRPVNYTSAGPKDVRVRVSYADGSVYQSHLLVVSPAPQPQARYAGTASVGPFLLIADRDYNGVRDSATISVEYGGQHKNPADPAVLDKPLIVVKGFDMSRLIPEIPRNTYELFVRNQFNKGGILLSDGLDSDGYDIVYVDFENGTDYIQRNARVLEKIIQWVNDNKTGNAPNVILAMSMGGIVAQYALREIETTTSLPAHQVRLLITHDTPHQGANVPLSLQMTVRHLAGIVIRNPFGDDIVLADRLPIIVEARNALLSPLAQQLLRYQTTRAASTRAGGVGPVIAAQTSRYESFQQEYQALLGSAKVPVGTTAIPLRVVAVANGSECGRAQPFGPYAEFVHFGYNGEVYNFPITYALEAVALNTLALAIFPPAAVVSAALIPILLGLSGAYDLTAAYHLNALPDQDQKQIYSIFVQIEKHTRIYGLFRLQLTIIDFQGYSLASELPLDSGSGGIISISDYVQQTGGVVSSLPAGLLKQQQFCFTPTFSTLDITPTGSASLTAEYSPGTNVGTPFANFRTATRENESHVQFSGANSAWMLKEVRQTPQVLSCEDFCQANLAIAGPSTICSNGATFNVSNLPAGINVSWALTTTADVTTTTGSATVFTTAAVGPGGNYGTLAATLSSDCGELTLSKAVYIGAPIAPATQGPNWGSNCGSAPVVCTIDNFDPTLIYTLTTSGALSQVGGVRANGTYSVRSNQAGGQGSLTITAANTCDTSSSSLNVTTPACGNSYAVYPNPADNQLTVEQTSGSQAQARGSQPLGSSVGAVLFTATLYDGLGTLRLNVPSTAALLQLSTALLPAGLYVLHLEANGVVVQRQVQIIH